MRLPVVFGLEFVEVYVLGVSAVDDEAVAQDEWFLAGEGDGVSAWIDGILHRALSSQDPLVGIAGIGFVAKNGETAYPVIVGEFGGEVEPRAGLYRGSLGLDGACGAGEFYAIRQSDSSGESAVGLCVLGAADANVVFESQQGYFEIYFAEVGFGTVNGNGCSFFDKRLLLSAGIGPER